jgi:hypothetical protein
MNYFPKIIPGHAKPKSGKSSRSPKGSLTKSPSASSLTKSSPKSPKSPSLAGLTDQELQKLKDSVVQDEEISQEARKPSVVKFAEM